MKRATELAELRESFEDVHGHWNETLALVLESDPDFFRAFLDLSSVPWRSGPLEPKVKELVNVAVDGAATHLYEPGFREHIRLAIKHGATHAELMEVMELAATLGIHACNVGVPILLDAMKAAGRDPLPLDLTERQTELKALFQASRGYWNPFWDGVLQLDDLFFEAYLNFSSVPWRHGVLEPKVKELIYIAFDAAATHMFLPGLRLHIENALGYGATPQEIVEVLELASTLGMHTLTVGVPILLDELERAKHGSA